MQKIQTRGVGIIADNIWADIFQAYPFIDKEIQPKYLNYFLRVKQDAGVRTHKPFVDSCSEFFLPYLLTENHPESELILCGQTSQGLILPSVGQRVPR